MKTYQHTCPICGTLVELASRGSLWRADTFKTTCRSCASSKYNKCRNELCKSKFISKSNRVHGNRYDYSNTIYTTSSCKVEINCPQHGKFFTTPNNHLRGSGCPKCASDRKSLSFSSTTADFIDKATRVHFGKYDYSNVRYINSNTKVKIKCNVHGEFLQNPASHLFGCGCPKCSHVISSDETVWLNMLHVTERTVRLPENPSKPVDGYDPMSRTVYEFLGDYWHGNPKMYSPNDIHPHRGVTFGKIYEDTFRLLNHLKLNGYNVRYIWESDFHKQLQLGKVESYLL